MKKNTWFIVIAIILVGIILWAINLNIKAPSANSIKIGSVLPLTGSAAVWGINAKRGMDLALDEINNQGGINGKQLVVIYEDSGSDPKNSTSALEKLISTENVQVVIGDIASSSFLAMAPIAERKKVVILSPGASNPDITQAGQYVFRNWQSDALEGEVDATFAYNTLAWRKVAILNVNNAYGAGLAGVFDKSFSDIGGNVIIKESFLQDTTDMRTQITKISSAKPDGIYMPGYPKEMATILKQMHELGINIPILSVQAFDDPEILSRANEAAEGVIFSVPTPPDTSDPIVSNFQQKYELKYGKKPGVCSDTGYDAVYIVQWAFQQGAINGEDICRLLPTLKGFPGAAGMTTFDENGDVVREFSFKQVRNGNFENFE